MCVVFLLKGTKLEGNKGFLHISLSTQKIPKQPTNFTLKVKVANRSDFLGSKNVLYLVFTKH